MDEHRTRALLTRVVDKAPPPAPVDLDLVIELGEARLHDRTRWVITAAAALVLVVSVAVAALTLGTDADRAAPPAAPAPANRVPALQVPAENPKADLPLPGTAPTRFDPARSELLVGAVPDSLTERGTAVRTGQLVYYATGQVSQASGKVNQFLQIMVGPRGSQLGNDLEDQVESVTDGPLIDGRRSKWYDLGSQWGGLLRWEWAPGAQAYINVRGLPDQRELAERLASTLTVNLDGRVKLPHTLRAPYDYTLAEFQSTIDTAGRRSPSATVVYSGSEQTFISVTANTIGNGIGNANTTYADRPARVNDEHMKPGETYTTVTMAADDLKVTGTCNYREGATLTAAEFKDLCLSTTASADRIADLYAPATWPAFTPR